MEFPSNHPALVPHSSFHQIEHATAIPSLDYRNNHLTFAQEKHFPTPDPPYGLYYTPSFPREVTENFQQFLPALTSSHSNEQEVRKCLGCVNHDECDMFKPMPLRLPLDREAGDNQRPLKKIKLDNLESKTEQPFHSGKSCNELRKPAVAEAPKRESSNQTGQDVRSSPGHIDFTKSLQSSNNSQSTPEYTVKQEVSTEETKDNRDVEREKSTAGIDKKLGRSHNPSLNLSPNCGLFLHKSSTSTVKDEASHLARSDEMTIEDFVHKCPTSKRHEFNNAVATELFPLKQFLFPSKRAFLSYLTEQQKWRWDFYQAYVDVATRVNNTLYKPSSGFAQNCTRFSKMPDHPRGEDVRRCEATSKVLEDIASRIADFRIEVLRRKGAAIYTEAGEARLQPCVSELKFLEQIFEETNKLYDGVITMMTNVNTTWEKLQRLFSEEQVERAERQRVLRRQRENMRKKKKRALVSFEKAAVKLLYKIAPLLAGQAEHSRTVDELNIMELNMLNTQRDGEMLQFLLDKQYFSGQAIQVILGKIRMLEAICGLDNLRPAVPTSSASQGANR
ncbi:uncharacterized protein [Apostichopus japonicus]|uniref:uncharacterized protein n=1 Tax=Stichopus japonicus TaxID=307972 RepID=UPI003AB84B50